MDVRDFNVSDCETNSKKKNITKKLLVLTSLGRAFTKFCTAALNLMFVQKKEREKS